jgi:hypothetical protein
MWNNFITIQMCLAPISIRSRNGFDMLFQNPNKLWDGFVANHIVNFFAIFDPKLGALMVHYFKIGSQRHTGISAECCSMD